MECFRSKEQKRDLHKYFVYISTVQNREKRCKNVPFISNEILFPVQRFIQNGEHTCDLVIVSLDGTFDLFSVMFVKPLNELVRSWVLYEQWRPGVESVGLLKGGLGLLLTAACP